MIYGWLFLRREGHSLSYYTLKGAKVLQDIDVCIFKVIFLKQTLFKTDVLVIFIVVDTNCSVANCGVGQLIVTGVRPYYQGLWVA